MKYDALLGKAAVHIHINPNMVQVNRLILDNISLVQVVIIHT